MRIRITVLLLLVCSASPAQNLRERFPWATRQDTLMALGDTAFVTFDPDSLWFHRGPTSWSVNLLRQGAGVADSVRAAYKSDTTLAALRANRVRDSIIVAGTDTFATRRYARSVGGAGSSFSWSVTGSAAVSDSLRFVQAYGGTWARTGNTVTYTPDTSTANTGLATVGDIARGTSDSSRASFQSGKLVKSGVDVLIADTTASAVNQLTVRAGRTSEVVALKATGTDANITIALVPKGDASVSIGDFFAVSNQTGRITSIRGLNTHGDGFGVPPIVFSYRADDSPSDLSRHDGTNYSGAVLVAYYIQPNGDGTGSYDFKIRDAGGDNVMGTVDMSSTTPIRGTFVALSEASITFEIGGDGTYDLFYCVTQLTPTP